MRESIARMRKTFDTIKFSFFMLLEFHFACSGKKQNKDMMIEDGPPDISENIQFTSRL
jgi:hypothetical protein